MKVFRYVLKAPKEGFETSVRLPKGSQILCADVKKGETSPSLWAMVDPKQPEEERKLLFLPTGIELPGTWKFVRYVSTIQMQFSGEPTLCFHVFEPNND